MSTEPDYEESIVVNVGDWVERAKTDPVAYLERQATELFLATLATIEPYRTSTFLKGGILMGVVYESHRQTGDIDLTTTLEPKQGVAEEFTQALNDAFPHVSAEIGYLDLMCRVQSHKYFPRGEAFPKNDGPAIKLGIGYAKRGSNQEKLFHLGRSPDKLEVDISFREPICAVRIIKMAPDEYLFRAYSLSDLIAEKIRALLQQESRNRYRRQDFYDLSILINQSTFNDPERKQVYETLLKKCHARDIEPTRSSLTQPEVRRRAERDWNTMRLEIGDLPMFDMCFAVVVTFYESLPWPD
jgi:hypothetical protein